MVLRRIMCCPLCMCVRVTNEEMCRIHRSHNAHTRTVQSMDSVECVGLVVIALVVLACGMAPGIAVGDDEGGALMLCILILLLGIGGSCTHAPSLPRTHHLTHHVCVPRSPIPRRHSAVHLPQLVHHTDVHRTSPHAPFTSALKIREAHRYAGTHVRSVDLRSAVRTRQRGRARQRGESQVQTTHTLCGVVVVPVHKNR